MGTNRDDMFGGTAGYDKGAGLININNILKGGLSRKNTSGNIRELTASFNKLLADNGIKGDIVVLDKEKDLTARISAIIFTQSLSKANTTYTCAHTLLLEETMDVSNLKVTPIGNRNVEEVIVPGDLYPELWPIVQSMLEKKTGISGEHKVLDGGASVVPKHTNIEDEQVINGLAYEMITAVTTILGTFDTSIPKFSIKMVGPNDRPYVAIDYNSLQSETVVGDPVRSDINVSLKSSVASGQTVDLTTLDTFVDLVYVEPQPQAYGQPLATQHYVPRIVITKADTAVNAITSELMLLGLTTAGVLAKNMAWAGAFKPRHGVKGIDTRDIGAIGYELNLTGDPKAKLDKVNLKSKNVTRADVLNFIAKSVHDAPIISMDIEEVGGNSWLNQTYIAAANGNDDAVKIITEACDVLTGGNFTKEFTRLGGNNNTICHDDYNRIHLGYYTDENGQRCDIRTIDYLALLNIAGKQDNTLVIKWAETFENKSVPMEIRLEDRMRILNSIVTSGLHITGYARRVTFNPVFLSALANACAQAGLHIQATTDAFSGAISQRGNNDVINYAIDPNAAGNLFVNGGYQTAGQPQYFGRFG